MTSDGYLELDELAAQQIINASGIFAEFQRAVQAARPYAGGMYWKRLEGYEYLIKTGKANRQQSLGRRDERTEAIHEEFHRHKAPREERLKTLQASLNEAERFNKAAKAGRVPNVVIAVLRAFERHGLGKHFTVVGTHALFAYEAAAGVRIVQKALATVDVDLLWDARKRVRFETDIQHLDRSVLSLLQEADKTFQRIELQKESAANAKGFQVDFLRRMPQDTDPHPYRFSKDPDDLWPVQARRADVLTEASRFESPVIGTNGQMALMRTISPQVFVAFKLWMSEQRDRDPIKRERDGLQAKIVQGLMDEGRLRAG